MYQNPIFVLKILKILKMMFNNTQQPSLNLDNRCRDFLGILESLEFFYIYLGFLIFLIFKFEKKDLNIYFYSLKFLS